MRYLIILLTLLSSACYGQTDTLEYYLDWGKRPCTSDHSIYFRRAYKEGELWRVKDFYVTQGSLEQNGVFAKHEGDSFKLLTGMVYFYHRNGKLKKKVRYIDDLVEGMLKEYDTAGRLVDSALFKHGIPYKSRFKWDGEGNITFKGVYDDLGNGTGEEWEYHDDGKIASYGKTGQGYKKDSVWTYYHENGIASSVELYYKDSLVSIACYEEDGKPSTDKCVTERMAEAPYDMNQYLGSQMNYPTDARYNGIQGRVNIQFVVDKMGVITKIKVIGRRLGGGCDEEAMRVVAIMPKWRPGKSHNRPVQVYYTLPVSFRFE